MWSLRAAQVAIVGHTDNIGKEAYNLKLSERRAKAVYDQIAAAIGETPSDTLTHMGVGSFDPLYGNGLPENRALNRTVTVTLEDEQGTQSVYRIVGADEFDPARGWISIDSPMARALLKRHVDDEISVATPSGRVELVITAVRYSPPD